MSGRVALVTGGRAVVVGGGSAGDGGRSQCGGTGGRGP